MRKLVILSICLLFAFEAQALAFFGDDFDGLWYTTNDDNTSVTVSGYSNGTVSTIKIPSSVTHNGVVYPVTSIGASVFSDPGEDWFKLTYIIIPNSVTSIGANAFRNCSDLISIRLPSNLKSVGSGAFYRCSGLTSIRIPSGVTSIGKEAFKECAGLTSVTISSEEISIEESAFSGCTSLSSVTIPSGVTSLRDSVFYNCIGLQEIYLQNPTPPIMGVDVLDQVDKSTCKLYVPIGTKEAYAAADQWKDFRNIEEIKRAPILDFTVNDLTYHTNADSTSVCLNGFATEPVGELEIPSSVTYNGKSYPVTSIGVYAFAGCYDLISVTIPFSVTSIGSEAFFICYRLTTIQNSSSLISIGACAFEGCPGLTSITIPEGVTSIEYRTFLSCHALTSITIPSSVTSIEAEAFWGCRDLQEIFVNNTTPPTVGTDGFFGVDKSTCKLYVPIGSKEAYATADGWKDFQNIEEVEMIPDKSEYTYQPFIMDGTCEWQSLSWRDWDQSILNVNRRVISDEDSVYQGKMYKKIFDYPSCTTNESSKVYVGLIREEDKRVYCVGYSFTGEYPDTEWLLYDFNLNVGDTINYPWESFKISRIDTVQNNGIWRRVFYFVYLDYPEDEALDFWMEGVGTANYKGILDPLTEMPESGIMKVQCVIHGNDILYKPNSEEDCPCSSLSSQPVVEDVDRISFYVRDRQLCIHAPDQAFTILKIYTSDGKLIKSVSLREQTDEITSSLEGLTPGSYLFIVGSADSQQSGQFVVR